MLFCKNDYFRILCFLIEELFLGFWSYAQVWINSCISQQETFEILTSSVFFFALSAQRFSSESLQEGPFSREGSLKE